MRMNLVCRHCGSTACVRRYRSRELLLHCTICGLVTRVYRPRHRPPVQRVVPRGPTLAQLPLELGLDVARAA